MQKKIKKKLRGLFVSFEFKQNQYFPMYLFIIKNNLCDHPKMSSIYFIIYLTYLLESAGLVRLFEKKHIVKNYTYMLGVNR